MKEFDAFAPAFKWIQLNATAIPDKIIGPFTRLQGRIEGMGHCFSLGL